MLAPASHGRMNAQFSGPTKLDAGWPVRSLAIEFHAAHDLLAGGLLGSPQLAQLFVLLAFFVGHEISEGTHLQSF